MPFIKYGDHTIEVRFERQGGETVLYHGEIMSSKISVFGATQRSCQKVCKYQATASTSSCLASPSPFLSLKPNSR